MPDFGTPIRRSLAAPRGATESNLRAIRQPNGPRGLWLALAALAISPFATPAAAQFGSEAVVCVGSERRTLATNPIRRVYTEDMEIVYRIGVDIGQRDQVERTLSSELGSYPEVWCAWSDLGEDHAVIVSYTGVIRRDPTLDPEDPRFQAFNVGFGPDFDVAESQATTINQRFSSYNDGSGYEVRLRETWGAAEGVVAAGSEPAFSPPAGPICSGSASSEGCWMEASSHAGCYLWNPFPQDDETVAWSGECSEGLAHGQGETTWYQNAVVSETDVDPRGGGKPEGLWVIRDPDGSRSEGPYVNGERHGTWTYFDENDDELRKIRYENARPVGGADGAVGSDQEALRELGKSAVDLVGYPYDKDEIAKIAACVVASKIGFVRRARQAVKRNREYIVSEHFWECYGGLGTHIEYDQRGFIALVDSARVRDVQLQVVVRFSA